MSRVSDLATKYTEALEQYERCAAEARRIHTACTIAEAVRRQVHCELVNAIRDEAKLDYVQCTCGSPNHEADLRKRYR